MSVGQVRASIIKHSHSATYKPPVWLRLYLTTAKEYHLLQGRNCRTRIVGNSHDDVAAGLDYAVQGTAILFIGYSESMAAKSACKQSRSDALPQVVFMLKTAEDLLQIVGS